MDSGLVQKGQEKQGCLSGHSFRVSWPLPSFYSKVARSNSSYFHLTTPATIGGWDACPTPFPVNRITHTPANITFLRIVELYQKMGHCSEKYTNKYIACVSKKDMTQRSCRPTLIHPSIPNHTYAWVGGRQHTQPHLAGGG